MAYHAHVDNIDATVTPDLNQTFYVLKAFHTKIPHH